MQVDACNQLNINLTNQISEMTKKYNNAVLVFCGAVLAAALLLFWLFLQYHNGSVSPPSPVEDYSSPSNTLFNTKSPVQSSYMSSTTSGHNIRYDSVLIISSTSLYESLEESGMMTTTSDAEIFLRLWEILQQQEVTVSYRTLLSLVTGAVVPFLSLGLVASCIGVLFSTLAAIFSVLFFWRDWDGPTQLLTALLYTIGFISSGLYMHKTARDPALQIPAGSSVVVGCCAVYLIVLAVFQTSYYANIIPGNVVPDKKKHKDYAQDPIFWITSTIAVGSVSSGCLCAIPFAPLTVLVVCSGGGFILSMSFLLTEPRKSSSNPPDDFFVSWITAVVELGYAVCLWVLFNPHNGYWTIYSVFAQGSNFMYPLVTDVASWMEWSACSLGFLATSALVLMFTTEKVFDKGRENNFFTIMMVGLALYFTSLGTIYGGVLAESFAVALMGHLGIIVFNVLTVGAPVLFLGPCYVGLFAASTLWQTQAQSLVGPLESLSSVVLGPMGIFIYTIMAALSDSSKHKTNFSILALVMNIALIAWGSHVSRTLMFLVGLTGIAVFVIQLGLTHMKGSASFVFMLVVLSGVVVSFGIYYQ